MSRVSSEPIQIDLRSDKIKKIHIVGIGGAGMSAIAIVLNRMGIDVCGSDLKESHVTERLCALGIQVSIPHDKNLISKDVSLVVISSAIDITTNEEVLKANELGIIVVSRADILAAICAIENTVGISGSHGKTTTTSMVAAIARVGDLNPSFMIGGDVNEIGTNAVYNEGSILVVEADESDRTFLRLPLKGAIVTNIEMDHLENYGDTFDVLKDSFLEFINNVDGPVIICTDEPNSKEVSISPKLKREVISVGKSDADYTYEIIEATRGGICAQVQHKSGESFKVELAVPGIHNIKNALCALAICREFGVSYSDCINGLATFGGVARRFQFRGQTKGITFVDDYAHLPSEIQATLAAAKDGGFNKILSVFQPHRYSRTQAQYKQFAQSLMDSEVVAVCDVYSAGEAPRQGVSGNLIVEEMKRLGHQQVSFVKHLDEVIRFVQEHALAEDIVLTMGAGDVTMYSDVIQKSLSQSSHDLTVSNS